MKRIRIGLIVIGLMLFAFPAAVHASPVGIITAIEGRADITRGDEPARPAIVGDEVHIGDFLRTLSKSRLEMAFIDDSVTRLAPLSRLRVTEYLFDAGERTGTIDLLRGKVQSVLVKATPDSIYEIHTPTAVAGVRGTTFFVYYRDGVTGGASREGTFYVYSKGRPDQVRLVRPGQAFLVMGVDEIPIVRPATEEELDRHLDDTTIREDEDLRDEEDFLNGGDVSGDAQSGTRYADAADLDTELTMLDPGTEPMPEQTIPTEPPLPEPSDPIVPDPIVPDPIVPGPGPGVNISGTSTNAWGLVNISLVSSSPATMGLNGDIYDPGLIGSFYTAWTAPVSIADGTQGLIGIFSGTTGIDGSDWFGILPGFHMTDDGVLGYTLGMLEGTGSPGDGDYGFDGGGPADYVVLTTDIGEFEVDEPIFDDGIWGDWIFSSGSTDVIISYVGATSATWSIMDLDSGDEWSVWTVMSEGSTTVDLINTSWDDLFVSLILSSERNWAYARAQDITIGSDGTFEQKITGSWIDIDDAITGVMGGMVKGAFDPFVEDNYSWHAVAGGISLETTKFLDMAENDAATLEALNIPFVEVGTTTLSCSGAGSTGSILFTMNDVRFFAYSSGAAPLIWATGEVSGTYTDLPLGVSGNVAGDGWEGSFSVTRWDGGAWASEISGTGPVDGITGSVDIFGGAAGSYTATSEAGGTLDGTASGVVVP